MTTQEIRTKANDIVKSFGLTKKDVSVSVFIAGYSTAVKIKAKHENIDFKGLDKALNKLSVVDRCDVSGEILSGGNTYVSLFHPDGYTRNWNY